MGIIIQFADVQYDSLDCRYCSPNILLRSKSIQTEAADYNQKITWTIYRHLDLNIIVSAVFIANDIVLPALC